LRALSPRSPAGENPTERAGAFTFRVWFERGNTDEPTIEILAVECASVRFKNDETSRKPTHDENELLSAWFESALDTLPDVFSGVEANALELLYIDTCTS